jgi:drug/metabolite transporter (DMT)-like permease
MPLCYNVTMNFGGIFYAIGAMLGWGVGDFTIERATIKAGAIPSLFYITAAAGIVLFPFAWPHLGAIFLNQTHLLLLIIAGIATFTGAAMQFIAFETGKLSVIEPILGLELPITIGLAIVFGGEHFSWLQGLLTLVFFLGLVLAITRHHLQLHYHKRMFERGVILSLGAAILYGLQNFTVGNGSQQISPLATIWFVHTFTALLCLCYFAFFPQTNMMRRLKRHWKLVTAMVILDNTAWILYSLAVVTIPISLAITIGESYIILTVLLGLFVNRDKVKRHQILGIAMGCISVIILSYLHPG